jgi:hypothetical protein
MPKPISPRIQFRRKASQTPASLRFFSFCTTSLNVLRASPEIWPGLQKAPVQYTPYISFNQYVNVSVQGIGVYFFYLVNAVKLAES